jgi:hypothetical protein
MMRNDAFERHCDRFVTLCHQVIVPGMEKALPELEARGCLGDIRLLPGEPARRHRLPVEPEVMLTLLIGSERVVRTFVRFSGNCARQAVDVTVGRPGQLSASECRPMHEVTAELVQSLITQALACTRARGRTAAQEVIRPREQSIKS